MTGVPADLAQWTALLAGALDALPTLIPDGALGYLAATGKVENPVRDAVAFSLHRQVKDSGYMVAREWLDPLVPGRRDLAVLNRDEAAVLRLEAKALYGFDVPKRPHSGGYLHGMKSGHGKDAASLHLAARHGHTCFLVSLVTHPMAIIPSQLVQVIKYAATYNRRLRAQTAEELFDQARTWAQLLTVHGPLAHQRTHDLGGVYGVPFRLSCYLIGPVS